MAENTQISPETEPKISSVMKSFLSAAAVISNVDDCEYILGNTANGLCFTISVPASAYKALSGKIFHVFSATARPLRTPKNTITLLARQENLSALFLITASGENTEGSATLILELIRGAKKKYLETSDTPSLET